MQSVIVDSRGVPFERKQLAESQSSKIGLLHSRWEEHPSQGLTPPKLAAILRRAEQGDLVSQHELFQDMEEKDAHLSSDMQKRRMAPQTLDWAIKPPANATKEEEDHAAYIREVITAMTDFEDVLVDMTDAIGHGFAALEYTWERVEKEQLPVRAEHRPQSWFCLPQTLSGKDRNTLRLRDGTAEGQALWPFGWMLHRHRSRSGYISRMGLFRVLVWPFLFKNYAVRDLAEFLEIYGLPLRLGTYHASASPDDKRTLLRAVTGIGHDAAAIIPEGMKIDFKEAATGEETPFNSMVELMERSMSKAILGGTLTSGEGQHGTQALGNVHNEVRHEFMQVDARQLASTLTSSLIYPILAVNRGLTNMRRCPRFEFDTQEPEDIKLLADSLPKLVSLGMQIKTDWAHDKLKIPRAEKGDDVLKAQSNAPAQPAEPGQAKTNAHLVATLAATVPTAAPDELDVLADEMLGQWEDSLGELIEPVETALAAATSYQDFQDALEAQIATIEPARLVELLARGGFAARMWGRLNSPKRGGAEK